MPKLRLPRLLRRHVRRGLSDERGFAASEFAILAPIMVFSILATTEVFDAMRASRRAVDTSATIADLTSRLTTMTEAAGESMMATGQALMAEQGNNASLKITVSSIANRVDEKGDEHIEIKWSHTNKGGILQNIEGLDLPTIPPGESVVLSQVSLDYNFLFGFVDTTAITMEKNAVRRPRFTNEIVFLDNPS